MSNSRRSAAQLLAELAADPKWVEARAEDDAKRAAEEAELAAEEEPILAELRRVGVDVPSTWSLIEEHRDATHPRVLPILLDHLARPYHPAIREGMARALGAPVARPIWRSLAGRYVAEDNDQVKQGLACAVAETVTDDTLGELLALIADPRNGLTRNLLLLARMPARAATALEGLVADPDLRQELPRLLKRLRRSRKAAAGASPSPLDPALEEASSGFDLESVPAFLSILVRLGFGFERSHAKAVRAMVDTLDVGDERELRFDLAGGGGTGTLVVRAFLDDPHAVDLYFFGSPAHTAMIQAEMERLGD